MRVLITGSRDNTNVSLIEGVLNGVYEEFLKSGRGLTEEFVVVHGGARGADFIASRWTSKHLHIVNERHPADWDQYKRAAGAIRNQVMVDLGADVCLAFPLGGSIGTWDCVNKAKKADIEVRIFD